MSVVDYEHLVMQTVSNANFGPLIAYLVPGAWGHCVGRIQLVPVAIASLVCRHSFGFTDHQRFLVPDACIACGRDDGQRRSLGRAGHSSCTHRTADARMVKKLDRS
jgi:hypothetical protein